MKTIKILGLFLASVIVGLGFSGCKEDVYQSRIKELILTDMTFPSDASSGIQTFRYEDMSHYAISSNATWCQAKIYKDSSQIWVNVDANKEYDQRVAVITLSDVTDTTQARTFNVTQAQLDALLIDDQYTHFSDIATSGGQVTIKVKSNVPFSLKIDENNKDWITQNLEAKTRGLQDSSIVLDIAKNESCADRTGYAYIVNGKKSDEIDTITIKQRFDAILDVDPLVLSIDELGGIVKVTVKTNIVYDIYSQSDWITKSSTKQENDTTAIESFRVEPLTDSKKSRTGYVIIENAAWDDLQKKVKITQTRSLYIENGDISVDVGSSVKIELTNTTGDDNVIWESSNKKVATVTSDGTVEGVSQGTATITVSSSDSEHTYSVKVVVRKVAEEESGNDKQT